MKVDTSVREQFTILARRKSIQLVLLLFFFSCQPERAEEPYLLGYGHGIHSYTLFVKDLPATSTYWRDTLGFDVPTKEDFEIGPFTGSAIASIFLRLWLTQ